MRCVHSMAVRSVAWASILASGAVFGCGSTQSSASSDTSDSVTPGVKAAALGFVVDTQGQPLAGVSVRSGAESTTTDAGGRFNLPVPVGKTSVLTIEHTGWAPAYRTVKADAPGSITVSAVLKPPTTTTKIDTSVAAATVDVPGEVHLKFPQGSLVLSTTGKPPTGPVDTAITWVPPEEAVKTTPIPLVGTDGTQTLPLETWGMIDLKLSSGGVPVQLAPGSTVEWTVPAPSGAPDSTGLFYGDPALGMWKLEGAVARVGDKWVAQLPHLSWWNVDGFYKVPTDKQACVDFHTVDATGKDVSGVELKSCWGPSCQYTIAGGTDVGGRLCEDSFPLGQTITMNWKSILESGGKPVTGSVSVTPTAKGAKCGTAACEVVTIVVACTEDDHCYGSRECIAGKCQNPGTQPVTDAGPTGDAGSDAQAPACVPKCNPNQCTDDGCGKPCGECPKGQSCNPTSQVCAICTPDCSGQVCGSDGCNGSCGICPAGQSCDGANCTAPCSFCQGGNCDSFGFEDGITGWDVSGDASVVLTLGSTPAPQGQKMLRLSTGLAFSAPSYAQKALCASATVSKVTFRWRMYSEEFKEYCGSSYQDYFSVSVIGADKAKNELQRVTIDDLCPVGEKGCTKCGGKFVGLDKSDLKFDKGDAWGIPWQETTLNLPAGASTATLVFEVNDVGDSSYDTVVLLDDIRLN